MQYERISPRGFLHGIEWIVWMIFKNHLLEVGRTWHEPRDHDIEPRDHGTANVHSRSFILIYHVRGPP